MCAICGVINFDHRPVQESVVVAMRDAMVNRGPDHAGLYVDEFVALGHRRLKIIDLSVNGNQPMTNEDQTVWVVFNGEIYNFLELRRLLLEKGHHFHSQADTEVIVHGYEEWGEALIPKLDGMFAIGLWDARMEKLLLARDRFGKKPLYYWQHGARVSFASEIKSFWLDPDARLTLNYQALDCYLHHLAVTQDHCVFNETAKVKPGHYLTFARGQKREVRYWLPAFEPKLRLSETEALHLMDERLRAAVKRRLISDVPLGAFLSGGVDSSVVVALMSQFSGKPCQTFSIGFEEQDYSELKYARQVAERYRTDHQEIHLKPDVLEVLPSLIWEYGEPFADSSAIPTYYVSKAARQFVTVALTGDGGDEMFGGYDIAKVSFYAHYLNRFCPRFLKSMLEKWLFAPSGPARRNPGLRKLKTMLVHAHADPAIRHSISMAFSPAQKELLYTPEFHSRLGDHAAHHIYEAFNPDIMPLNVIDQNLFLTIVRRLPNDYLVKVDVASMKSALELRCPFLDTSLCELAGSLDPLLKVRGGRPKYLLKRLAERYLPHEVIYRPKQGFALPLEHWLCRDLLPALRRFLPDGSLIRNGWFRKSHVRDLIDQHAARSADHTHRLWALLWLELWHRMFVERLLKPTDSLK